MAKIDPFTQNFVKKMKSWRAIQTIFMKKFEKKIFIKLLDNYSVYRAKMVK